MMDMHAALARLADGQDLAMDEMAAVMRQVMTGEAERCADRRLADGPAQQGRDHRRDRRRGEVMRELATGVQVDDAHAIDIVGTGGDGANLFNVSTAASFVAAAAGARVAKHGNRSVSSQFGQR